MLLLLSEEVGGGKSIEGEEEAEDDEAREERFERTESSTPDKPRHGVLRARSQDIPMEGQREGKAEERLELRLLFLCCYQSR